MEQARTQAIITQLREEIRRREGSPGADREVRPSGFGPLDELLPGGGFPAGRVVELCGSQASGKTTLALMALARAPRGGALAAFVDPAGELYPPAARALGADLSRLLILRPRDRSLALRSASLLARSQAFAVLAASLGEPGQEATPKGPLSRRLLEAAETGRAAVILLSDGPSGLDATLRIGVERVSEREVALAVERSRMGPPGRTTRGELPWPKAGPVESAAPPAPPLEKVLALVRSAAKERSR